MHKSWRLLALAAAVNVCLGVGVAAGQTVIVRKAPPGNTVEVALSAATVASGTVDANGDAVVPFTLPETGGKAEIDAYIFVDVCDATRRVVIVERGRAPLPPAAGCDRREVTGLYWVRRVNTIVVDVGGTVPTLLLIKGAYGLTEPVEKAWTKAPGGLSIFGGGAYSAFRDASAISCGDASPCDGHDSGIGYSAGLTYWFGRFVAVEGSYVKPKAATASGSGETFRFDSSLDTRLATLVGKIGGPIGPVRLYGLAGVNYQRSLLSTSETINDAIQTFEVETRGWGSVFGGGGEVWLSRVVGLYGELTLAGVKGTDINGGEARIDDRLRLISFGARIHIGR